MAFDFTEFLKAAVLLIISSGCSSDSSLISSSVFEFEFPAKFDFGLTAIISTVSGVKAGGAAGLRCRFPSTTLVPFSLPSLKPLKKVQKFVKSLFTKKEWTKSV